jgi:hypothetical protein
MLVSKFPLSSVQENLGKAEELARAIANGNDGAGHKNAAAVFRQVPADIRGCAVIGRNHVL